MPVGQLCIISFASSIIHLSSLVFCIYYSPSRNSVFSASESPSIRHISNMTQLASHTLYYRAHHPFRGCLCIGHQAIQNRRTVPLQNPRRLKPARPHVSGAAPQANQGLLINDLEDLYCDSLSASCKKAGRESRTLNLLRALGAYCKVA